MSKVVKQRKKRSKYEIVYDILRNCQDGAKKTWVMYRVNLSYSLTLSYLDYLLKLGLVKVENDMFYVTDKGKMVLELLSAYIQKKRELKELAEELSELLPEREEK